MQPAPPLLDFRTRDRVETVLDEELIDRLEHWIAEARSTVPA